MRIHTTGHSNHSLDVLIDWLREYGIGQLIDIRRHPGSRRLPQFNRGPLERGLRSAGIEYRWFGEPLGGMREAAPGARGVDALPPGGLRNFAAYMNTAEFRSAIGECVRLAGKHPLAMLCAERDPARCHRQLISDYLVLSGLEVFHIVDPAKTVAHQPNPAARLEGGRIYYDRGTQGKFKL